MEDHLSFTINVNAAPLKGEMSVLFNGKAQPVVGHFIGPAVHDYYLIHIVLDGEGVFETLGESYQCVAGDAFVIFPDILVKYAANLSNPWQYMWVGFSGELVETALSSIGITPDRAYIQGCSLQKMNRLFRSLDISLKRTDFPALGNMEASGWLRMIFYELGLVHQKEASEGSVIPSRSFRQIDQAIRLLSLQYGKQLSIEEIAKSLGYHRAHLTRLFKEATGLSPTKYLLKVRMKKAEELLIGDLTVAQVAASVGYNDPLFFTKQFHKWSGLSPTEFRKKAIH